MCVETPLPSACSRFSPLLSPHSLVVHTPLLGQVHGVLVSVATTAVHTNTEGQGAFWWLARSQKRELSDRLGRDDELGVVGGDEGHVVVKESLVLDLLQVWRGHEDLGRRRNGRQVWCRARGHGGGRRRRT